MSVNTPSDAEEDYFRKEELERLERSRKKLDAERESIKAEQQRLEHWMRCPKCGSQMEEVLFRHIMVDRCTECGYIGFDNGELDVLISHEEPLLARISHEMRNLFSLPKTDD